MLKLHCKDNSEMFLKNIDQITLNEKTGTLLTNATFQVQFNEDFWYFQKTFFEKKFPENLLKTHKNKNFS